MKRYSISPLAAVVGASVLTATLASAAQAANPFQLTELKAGYQLAQDAKPADAKPAEGKCGEGKCGEGKKAAEAEGKCGEHKDAKPAEGKCGEGKCGDSKKPGGTA